MSFERITIGTAGPFVAQQTGTITANLLGAVLTETASSTFNESVAEALALADVLSGSLDILTDVVESVALSDAVSASGSLSALVEESITLTDAVSATGDLAGTVGEALTLADAVASSGTLTATIAEVMDLQDDVQASRQRRIWFLSFVDVTPPPQNQGPGNPGKLKGDYREEID